MSSSSRAGSGLGRLHSVQTLGAVDGPGLRFVAFLQGCPMRCAYCHNPDTWSLNGGRTISAEALVAQAARYRPYFGETGGLTLSGGEPLIQAAFCVRVAKLCRAQGIGVCLDTSGCRVEAATVELLGLVDLVILDIKHADPEAFLRLTGRRMEATLSFLKICKQQRVPLWIRQVTLPGWTDEPAQIDRLAALLEGADVRRAELLPYHTLGRAKWDALGEPYALDGVPEPTRESVAALQLRLNAALGLADRLDSV